MVDLNTVVILFALWFAVASLRGYLNVMGKGR